MSCDQQYLASCLSIKNLKINLNDYDFEWQGSTNWLVNKSENSETPLPAHLEVQVTQQDENFSSSFSTTDIASMKWMQYHSYLYYQQC